MLQVKKQKLIETEIVPRGQHATFKTSAPKLWAGRDSLEVEEGESEMLGHLGLQSQLKASLSYMTDCLE